MDTNKWESERKRFETIAIGQLPILKINGDVFYQSNVRKCLKKSLYMVYIDFTVHILFKTKAIIEWCANMAGIVPRDPTDAMIVTMISGDFAFEKKCF